VLFGAPQQDEAALGRQRDQLAVWHGLLVGRGKRRRTRQAESDVPPARAEAAYDRSADSSPQASAALQARLISEPCHTEQGHGRHTNNLLVLHPRFHEAMASPQRCHQSRK